VLFSIEQQRGYSRSTKKRRISHAHTHSGRRIEMATALAGPIFTVSTCDGRKALSLFGLMAATAHGEVIDLPAMAAHQRAPVVTTLAIMMHVLSRYAEVDRLAEDSWAKAWHELIGPDALRVTAPHNEVAFSPTADKSAHIPAIH
jgi:hypothetical protein